MCLRGSKNRLIIYYNLAIFNFKKFQFYSIVANSEANRHVTDSLCKAFASLSPAEQVALQQAYESKCNNGEGRENDQSIVDKRKPNFIRFGRSMGSSFSISSQK